MVYEATSKVIGIRVLDENGTMEITYREHGKLLGIDCNTTLTLTSKFDPDKVQHTNGYGISTTKDGDTATFTLSGIIIPKELPFLASNRGAAFFRTHSPKLMHLNSVILVYEAEVNEDMSYKVKAWEWK